MKGQILISGKNRLNILSAEFAQRVVMVPLSTQRNTNQYCTSRKYNGNFRLPKEEFEKTNKMID